MLRFPCSSGRSHHSFRKRQVLTALGRHCAQGWMSLSFGLPKACRYIHFHMKLSQKRRASRGRGCSVWWGRNGMMPISTQLCARTPFPPSHHARFVNAFRQRRHLIGDPIASLRQMYSITWVKLQLLKTRSPIQKCEVCEDSCLPSALSRASSGLRETLIKFRAEGATAPETLRQKDRIVGLHAGKRPIASPTEQVISSIR